MKMLIHIILLITLISCKSSNSVMSDYKPDPQKTITAEQAKDYVGKEATVCGVMVSGRFASRSKGRPTFLNLDKPYPQQIFTVVIWGDDRAKFGTPETALQDKKICVTGKIQSYQGKIETVVSEVYQIKVAQE